jgi:hypothetical protein
MNNLIKLDFRKQRGSSVLGLALGAGKLDGVVVRRTNGSVQLQQAFSVTLSLDPLTNDAALVGREIRNHLDAAGIKERRCIVGLPLKWALTSHAKLPALEEADVASFLQIEAERSFPCDVSTLLLGTSRYATPSGEKHATLIGIPRSQAVLLEDALRAAQLKPVSFSLGLTALQPAESEASNGVLALMIGESHVGLEITSGGGIAALRALEGALDTETGQRRLHADIVAREMRITLSQLPPEVRSAVQRVRIFGPRDLAQQLADEIELRLEAMDLQVELVMTYAARDFAVQVPADVAVSPAVSLAVGYLAGRANPLEFLPPRVTALQQFAARYSSGRMQKAGLAAALVVLAAAGAFGVQQWQISKLERQWASMKKTVQGLEDMQKNIKQFRPWFDFSIRGLTILQALTQAFPEDGSVTAKTVEIRDLGTITCTGIARDYQALIKTVAQLRKTPQVFEVNLGMTRGQAPAIQFAFTVVWREGGGRGN